MRFAPRPPYGILPGQLYDLIKAEFPEPEELAAAQVPIELDVAPLPRHRFRSADGHRMVQTGIGLVSINCTQYTGYESFRADVERVLEAALQLRLLTEIRRLGLRYINRAPLDRPWTDILTYTIKAPPIVEEPATARRFAWRTELEGKGVLQTVIAWPLADNVKGPAVVLDFDCFAEDGQVNSRNGILQWIDESHERIYNAFRDSLTDDYFKSLGKVANAGIR